MVGINSTGSGQQVVHVQRVFAGQRVVVQSIPGACFKFSFPAEAAAMEITGRDLVFTFPDEARIVIQNYVVNDADQLPSLQFEDQLAVTGKDTLASLNVDIVTAMGSASNVRGSGLSEYQDAAGVGVVSGVSRLSQIDLPEQDLRPLSLEYDSSFYFHTDLRDRTFAQQVPDLSFATAAVSEAALAAGSAPGSGVFSSITFHNNKVPLTITGVVTQGAHGTISKNAQGEWQYKLDSAMTHGAPGTATDLVSSDIVTVTVTDGKKFWNIDVKVAVTDDTPTLAVDPNAAVQNVISGADVTGVLSIVAGADGIGGLKVGDNSTPVKNGDVWTYELAKGSLSIDVTTGDYTYTAKGLGAGAKTDSDTVTFTLTDSDGDVSNVASITFDITKPWDPDEPVAPGEEFSATAAVSEAALAAGSAPGTGILSDITFHNNAVPLTITGVVTQGAHGTISKNAQGEWQYKLDSAMTHGAPGTATDLVSSDTVMVTVTDGQNFWDVAVKVAVTDDTPTLAVDPNAAVQNVISGADVTGVLSIVAGADGIGDLKVGDNSSPVKNGDVWTYELAKGSLSIDVTTGDYTYTPKILASNLKTDSDTVTFTLTDSDGDVSNVASITFDITKPWDPDEPVTPGEEFSATAAVSEAALAAGSAPGTGILSDITFHNNKVPLTITDVVSQGAYGTISQNHQGEWQYELNSAMTHGAPGTATDLVSSDTVMVTVTDGQNFWDVAVKVAVTDDTPTLAVDPNAAVQNVISGAEVTGVLSIVAGADGIGGLKVGENSSPVKNGDVWTYELAKGSLSIDVTTGDYTYTPKILASNLKTDSDIVTFTLTDSDGDVSNVASITFDITKPWDPDEPVAPGEEFSATAAVSEAALAAGSAPGTGILSDITFHNNKVPLTITDVVSQGAHGTISQNHQGEWQYELNSAMTHGAPGTATDLVSSDTVMVTVTDGQNFWDVAVKVAVTDDTPTLAVDPNAAVQNVISGADVTGVLSIVAGADGIGGLKVGDNSSPVKNGDVWTYELAKGSLSIDVTTGDYTYTAKGLGAGTKTDSDTVTFTLTDSDGDVSNVASITFDITKPWDPDEPVTPGEEFSATAAVSEAALAAGSAPGTGILSDITFHNNKVPLTITDVVSQGAHGTISQNHQGEWQYELNSAMTHGAPGTATDLVSSDTVMVTVTDGQNFWDVAVKVAVTDDTPTLAVDPNAAVQNVISGAEVTGVLSIVAGADGIGGLKVGENSSPVKNGDVWTYELAKGSLSIDVTTGDYTYTAKGLGAGTKTDSDTVTFTLTDSDGDVSNVASITFDITKPWDPDEPVTPGEEFSATAAVSEAALAAGSAPGTGILSDITFHNNKVPLTITDVVSQGAHGTISQNHQGEWQYELNSAMTHGAPGTATDLVSSDTVMVTVTDGQNFWDVAVKVAVTDDTPTLAVDPNAAVQNVISGADVTGVLSIVAGADGIGGLKVGDNSSPVKNGDVWTYELAKGSLSIDVTTGDYTYTAKGLGAGTKTDSDTVTFTLTDSDGDVSNVASITFDITKPWDPDEPVTPGEEFSATAAVSEAALAAGSAPGTGILSDITFHNNKVPLTITDVVSQGAHGTISQNHQGEWQYELNSAMTHGAPGTATDLVSSDTVMVTVTDGQNFWDVAVKVAVTDDTPTLAVDPNAAVQNVISGADVTGVLSIVAGADGIGGLKVGDNSSPVKNGDVWTYELAKGSLSIDVTTGDYTYTAKGLGAGTKTDSDTVTFTLTDSDGDVSNVASITFDITKPWDPDEPVTPGEEFSATAAVSEAALAAGSAPGTGILSDITFHNNKVPLTITDVVSQGAHGTISQNHQGEWQYELNSAMTHGAPGTATDLVSSDTVMVTVTDGQNFWDVAVKVAVTDDTPTLAVDPNAAVQNVISGAEVTGVLSIVAGADGIGGLKVGDNSSPVKNGDVWTYELAKGSLSIDVTTGDYTYTAKGLGAGTKTDSDTVTFTLTDSDGDVSNVASITFDITKPWDPDEPVTPGEEFSATAAVSEAALAAGSAPGTGILSDITFHNNKVPLTITDVVSQGAHGTISQNHQGEWQYELNSAMTHGAPGTATDLVSSDTVMVTVTDGQNFWDVAVKVAVTDDTPTLAVDPNAAVQNVISGADVTGVLSIVAGADGIGGLKVGDNSSPVKNGDVWTYELAKGSLSIDVTTGDYTYTAKGLGAGTKTDSDTVTFTLTDSDGDVSNVASITFDITKPWDPDEPVTPGEEFSATAAVSEAALAAGSAPGTGILSDITFHNNKVPLTITDVVSQGAHGTISQNHQGEWQYELNSAMTHGAPGTATDLVSSDTVMVTVTDGQNFWDVAVKVAVTDDTPTLAVDPNAAVQNVISGADVTGVLSIVAGADGIGGLKVGDNSSPVKNGDVWTYELAKGSLSIDVTTGDYTYTAKGLGADAKTDSDTVTFTLTDSDGDVSNVASITFDITKPWDPDEPVTPGEEFSATAAVSEAALAAGSAPGTGILSDITFHNNKVPLTITDVVSQGAHGTISQNHQGEWQYELNSAMTHGAPGTATDLVSSDTVMVTVTDGQNFWDVAVKVAVTDDTPTLAVDPNAAVQNVISGADVTGVLSIVAGADGIGGLKVGDNSSPVKNGDVWTYELAKGSLSIDVTTGDYTYTAKGLGAGTKTDSDTVTFTLTDSDGDVSNVASITFDITKPWDPDEPVTPGEEFSATAAVSEAALAAGSAPGTGILSDITFHNNKVPLTITDVVSQGAHGTISKNAQGEWQYELDSAMTHGAPGTATDLVSSDTVMVTVTDGQNFWDVAVKVAVTDDTPTLAVDPNAAVQNVISGADVTGVLSIVAGADGIGGLKVGDNSSPVKNGDVWTYELAKGSLSIDVTTGDYTYTAKGLGAGAKTDSDTVTFTLTDSDGDVSNVASITFDITKPWDPDEPVTPGEEFSATAAVSEAALAAGSAPGSGILSDITFHNNKVPLTITDVVSQGAHGTISQNHQGEWQYELNSAMSHGAPGTATDLVSSDTVMVTVTDGQNFWDVAVKVAVTDDTPTLAVDPNAAVQNVISGADVTGVLSIVAGADGIGGLKVGDNSSPVKNGDVWTYELAKGSLSIDVTTGDYTYTAKGLGAGAKTDSDTVTFTLTDSDGDVSNVASITFDITKPWDPDEPVTPGEEFSATAAVSEATLAAGSAPGSGILSDITFHNNKVPLTITDVVSQGAHGTISQNHQGEWQYELNSAMSHGAPGTATDLVSSDTVMVTVTDGQNFWDVAVKVAVTDDTPTLAVDPNAAVQNVISGADVTGVLSIVAGADGIGGLKVGDNSSPVKNGDVWTYELAKGSLSIDVTTGDYTYTAKGLGAGAKTDSDTVTFTLTDSDGDVSNVASITFDITKPWDPDEPVTPGEEFSATAAVSEAALAAGSAPGSGILSDITFHNNKVPLTITDVVSQGAHGTISQNHQGEWQYELNSAMSHGAPGTATDLVSSDTVMVTVTDGQNFWDVAVKVAVTDDTPTMSPDTSLKILLEGSEVTGTLGLIAGADGHFSGALKINGIMSATETLDIDEFILDCGTMTIDKATGSYTYKAKKLPQNSTGAVERMTVTFTDGDGDAITPVSLDIIVRPVATFDTVVSNLTVHEAGLSAGSEFGNSEYSSMARGALTIKVGEQLSSITLGGQEFALQYNSNGSISITPSGTSTVPYGTFEVKSCTLLDENTYFVRYTYELGESIQHSIHGKWNGDDVEVLNVDVSVKTESGRESSSVFTIKITDDGPELYSLIGNQIYGQKGADTAYAVFEYKYGADFGDGCTIAVNDILATKSGNSWYSTSSDFSTNGDTLVFGDLSLTPITGKNGGTAWDMKYTGLSQTNTQKHVEIAITDTDGDTVNDTVTFNYKDASSGGGDGYHEHLFAQPSTASYVPGQDYNISIILDTSGSMKAQGIDRLEQAITALKAFFAADGVLAKHDGTVNLQVVSFAEAAHSFTMNNFTGSYEQISQLEEMFGQLVVSGGTNYEAGLSTAAHWFMEHSGGVNKTFFITDGFPTHYIRTKLTYCFANYNGNGVTSIGSKGVITIPKENLYLGSEFTVDNYQYRIVEGSAMGNTWLLQVLNVKGNWVNVLSNETGPSGNVNLSYGGSPLSVVNTIGKQAYAELVNAMGADGVVTAVGIALKNDGILLLTEYCSDQKPYPLTDGAIPMDLLEGGLSMKYTPAQQVMYATGGDDVLLGDANLDILIKKVTIEMGLTHRAPTPDEIFFYVQTHPELFEMSEPFQYKDSTGHLMYYVLKPNGERDVNADGSYKMSTEVTSDPVIIFNDNDILLGGKGNDVLIAQGGDDLLIGNGYMDKSAGATGAQDSLYKAAILLHLENPDQYKWDYLNALPEESAKDMTTQLVNTMIDAIHKLGYEMNGQVRDDLRSLLDFASGMEQFELATQGEGGNNKLLGGAGNDILIGGSGNDTLWGGTGDDILIGAGGNDVFYAGEGTNILIGSTGDDLFFIGDGNNTLVGGGGSDIFAWQAGKTSQTHDKILDFSLSQNKMSFSELFGETHRDNISVEEVLNFIKSDQLDVTSSDKYSLMITVNSGECSRTVDLKLSEGLTDGQFNSLSNPHIQDNTHDTEKAALLQLILTSIPG